MTKRIGNNVVVLEDTGPATCSDCGHFKELRPYGNDGAWVCFECAMKDKAEMNRQFDKVLNGDRDI